jgi:hypothetical protein
MVRAANEKSTSFYFTLSLCCVAVTLLIYYDLGVLAFTLAVFFAIFGFGLRDKFSTEQTASAYSVFNRDGRSIVGGFTASQVERQLRGIGGREDDSDNPLKGPIAEHGNFMKQNCPEKLSLRERNKRRRTAAEAAQRRLQGKDD